MPDGTCSEARWSAVSRTSSAERIPGRSATELKAKLRAAGLQLAGSHHAHALHSPYWWLKCAVGVNDEHHPLVRRYRQFLEWDIVEQPRSTLLAERVLSPVLGKSLVLYATKPATVDQ